MKIKSLLILFVLLNQNVFCQAIESELDELTIISKKEKIIRISKGKKLNRDIYDNKFDEHYYLLDHLPYGDLKEITLYTSTPYNSYRWDDKGKKQNKEANKIYKSWHDKATFYMDIYAVKDDNNLEKLTEKPILVTFKKHKKLIKALKIDLSSYKNLIGDKFVISIHTSDSLHYCKEHCPDYGVLRYGEIFSTQAFYFNGKEIKVFDKPRCDITMKSNDY